MEMLNKDFYRNLPGMVPPILEDLIRRYRKEEWFEKAWNEYRHHILSSSMDEMKMPGFVFKKYIKDSSVKHSDDPNKFGVPEQKKFPLPDADHVRSAIKFFNYVQPEYEKELAKAILQKAKEYNVDLSEMSIGDNNRFKKYVPKNELMHFGILGQKWGVRRFQNEDGTLTEEGRKRYGYNTEVKYKNNSLILKDKITNNSMKISGVSEEQAKNFNENFYEKGLNEYLRQGNEICKSMGLKELTMPELLYILSTDSQSMNEAAEFVANYKNMEITKMIEDQIIKK